MADRPTARAWTPAQRAGIETVGRSLLLSAAAGSGKTAVLAERCAHLVCDAEQPCRVDELLVVTFTEAAAAEMKSRIQQALRSRWERHADGRTLERGRHLTRQLAVVERMPVSTLHSFCARLLRQYFHLVGLDPAFAVLDGEQQQLLRRDTAHRLLADRHDDPGAAPFHRLLETCADGDDDALAERVLALHAMLGSVADPAGWRDRALARLAEAADPAVPFARTDLGAMVGGLVRRGLAAAERACVEAGASLQTDAHHAKYADFVAGLRETVAGWRRIFDADGYESLRLAVAAYESPRMPTVRGADETIKARATAARDAIKKGPLISLTAFSEAEFRSGTATTLPMAQELLSLVAEFDRRYAHAKRAERAVDFTDLEHLALSILRDQDGRPSRVARSLHRQYRHVLVDEYQDINEVQDAILSLVSREPAARPGPTDAAGGNLFAVGDVKQSIYRFRLADPTRFLDRMRRFRAESDSGSAGAGRVIDLQANFRSRAPLLDAINAVFERLMTADAADIDYDATHRLVPGAVFPEASGPDALPGAPIELHVLPARAAAAPEAPAGPANDDEAGDADAGLERAEIEGRHIARRILQLMGRETGHAHKRVTVRAADGTLTTRPLRFGDIVLLLRTARHKADDYARQLADASIPVAASGGSGFFASTEIQDVLAVLHLLDNARQDFPLAAHLRSPLARLPDPEAAMARVRAAYPTRRDAPLPFHQAVRRYAAEHADDLAARLRGVLQSLHDWRERAAVLPLPELIGVIYDSTGLLAYVSGLPGGAQRRANLLRLHERATLFGTFRRQGLSRFLRFLEEVEEQTDAGQAPAATDADDAVRILTIHASKGLEFPVVFVPDLGKRFNLRDVSGTILADRELGVGLQVPDERLRVRYPSLASLLIADRIRRQSLAEELRVLYVAMTRAREHLVLVGSAEPDAPDRWRAAYANHDGPLAAETVQSASTMLGWLGPVWAATSAAEPSAPASSPAGPLRLIVSLDDLADDRAPAPEAPEPAPASAAIGESTADRLRALKPLTPAPPRSPVAEATIAALQWSYPYDDFTRVRAAGSVTALAKGRPAPRPSTPATPAFPESSPAAPPRLLRRSAETEVDDAAPLAATDRGTAVHIVFQHLDFATEHTPDTVRAVVASLVNRKTLTPAEADTMDPDWVLWFQSTPLGQLLRTHANRIRHEVPFALAVDPTDLDDAAPVARSPEDRVMVRGRIDLLLPLDDRTLLVDWKTDRVVGPALADRADFYAGQMNHYRRAVQSILSRPAESWLVFLTPRAVINIDR